MHITHLHLFNFRNYTELSFQPNRTINIILGRNAQGKTSLLEAIYFLATTSSWRTSKDSELVQWEAEQARVVGEVERESGENVSIEARLSKTEEKQFRINTVRQAKLVDVIGNLKVVLIDTHDVDIVRGEPSERRRFLNMVISQIRPSYCQLLAQYRRVLTQRNRLLKDSGKVHSLGGVIAVFDDQLVGYGSKILIRRLEFVRRLDEVARTVYSRITGGAERLEVAYVSKVDLAGVKDEGEAGRRMKVCLEEFREEEVRRGVTLVGPHRDDIYLGVDGVSARVYGSQGQQRTVALSLRLAELEMLEESAEESCVVLVDDVLMDLDDDRRGHVFAMAREGRQTFITAASKQVIREDLFGDAKVYEIFGGQVMSGEA